MKLQIKKKSLKELSDKQLLKVAGGVTGNSDTNQPPMAMRAAIVDKRYLMTKSV
ncbi:hypothetical protein J8M20_12625 [Pseudoalteromonas luteoviolacea]|uniref:hypothetical protein n=1 Tax=Pseudoalteromonas luteoviolacea TaxID=43657 RepID=UPI00159F2C27|nr:hypothetical protein [Pseudoalteromonas luteoviolacea]MBQ4812192.1 hypothetical protein [Pseudoalteromonas luteoviolacea]